MSRRARDEWAKQWLKDPASRAQFDAEWDKLAAIAAKMIPTYKPSAASYQFHDPVGEKLLMGALKNPALKIFRIGTDTAGWEVQKDSDNLPGYRYKRLKYIFATRTTISLTARRLSARQAGLRRRRQIQLRDLSFERERGSLRLPLKASAQT